MNLRRAPASEETSLQKYGPPNGLLSFSSISSIVNDLNIPSGPHPALHAIQKGSGKPQKMGCLDMARIFMTIDLVWIFKNLCEN